MAAGRSTLPALIDIITGIGFFTVLMLGGREIADGRSDGGGIHVLLHRDGADLSAAAASGRSVGRLADRGGQS